MGLKSVATTGFLIPKTLGLSLIDVTVLEIINNYYIVVLII